MVNQVSGGAPKMVPPATCLGETGRGVFLG